MFILTSQQDPALPWARSTLQCSRQTLQCPVIRRKDSEHKRGKVDRFRCTTKWGVLQIIFISTYTNAVEEGNTQTPTELVVEECENVAQEHVQSCAQKGVLAKENVRLKRKVSAYNYLPRKRFCPLENNT